MLTALPLSWARTSATEATFNVVKLPFSRRSWISTANIPFDTPFEQIYRQMLASHPNGFVIRGCNEDLSNYLTSRRCQRAQTGVEAVLNLQENSLSKASLQKLMQPGSRWGRVTEIPPTVENYRRMARFVDKTPYGNKPKLQYSFRTYFDSTQRGFALVAPSGDWLGALSLSLVNRNYTHTELLLRRKNAPPGVMDTLIAAVYKTLQREGMAQWSLGEVPFVSGNGAVFEIPCSRVFTSSCQKIFLKLRRLINFGYNFEGLYFFKNKFSPEWKPLYLCGKPDLNWLILLDLSAKTRYLHLLGNEIYCLMKKPFERQ